MTGFFEPDLVGNVLKLQRKIVAYFDKLISVKFISKLRKTKGRVQGEL